MEVNIAKDTKVHTPFIDNGETTYVISQTILGETRKVYLSKDEISRLYQKISSICESCGEKEAVIRLCGDC